ncbi:MAG TPA: BON domain-containing protein [Terriglobales bacterium]|nr:BON domain-containing protein [Terriglobales bacterium]
MKIFAAIVLLGSLAFAQSGSNPQLATRPGNPSANEQYIAKEVRHELVMLPYYSIFDDLEYQVKGDTVVLSGAVVTPTLKSDAENVVKKIEGVKSVTNNIKVLPPSPNDDQIRRRVARSIFGTDGLYRYSMSALPPVHIIVENGQVTLKGVVDSQGDKTLANVAANQVPGVFSVENELQVAGTSVAKK